MKILYSGFLTRWTTTEARLRVLRALGHDVDAVDIATYFEGRSAIAVKVQRHACAGPDLARYNRDLIARARDRRHDLVWFDTGAYVFPRTIAELRTGGNRILSYNSDYLEYRRYSWRQYFRAIPSYDVHVTTNELNIPILRNAGAKHVETTLAAYDPELHQPTVLSPEERARFDSDVAFVGHWEPAYERWLSVLVDEGLRVRVWGPGWNRRGPRRRMNGAIQDPDVITGHEAAKAIAGSRIAVGLLSELNRNQSAGRSFEIPAIGSFLLAIRTPEHETLYKSGVEAAFFSSEDELKQLVRRFRDDDDERKAIAEAGRLRCIRSGHAHADRVRTILAAL